MTVMLSLPKHLYRSSNQITLAVEMFRQAQHDTFFLLLIFLSCRTK